MFELNSRWTIDGSPRRNIARYINHACKPNAETDVVKGKIRITAIRTIRPGDEITYHYGRGYFDTFIKPKGCRCAACIEKRRAMRVQARRLRLARGRRRARAGSGKSHEDRPVRPCGARGPAAVDIVRRAPGLRDRRRRGWHLLPARGRAPLHAAQHGAGARRLSRRGRPRDQAHPARPPRLSPSALFAAAADRGNLHARSSQPRPAGSGGRPRRIAVRTQLSQDRPRSVARDFCGRLRLHQRRPRK